MPVIPFEGRVPRIHPSAFIAPTAVIIGDVEIGEGASIWYGCVLRGDLDPIRVGDRSNVQDNSVLHTSRGAPCIVKNDVTIGHMAMLHGCTIEHGCLIGMSAIVLDYAVVGPDCLVGAGSLVTKGKIFPPRQMILGSPAKAIRDLTEEEIAQDMDNHARYVTNGQRHTRMLEEWTAKTGWRW
ncbi:MAG: gamma carbonic anhydrase family protein [Sumerlaeia bacterium]